MRIIAGKHRHRMLLAPEGRATRPTSDRARESVFDILAHGRFSEQDSCLDAMVLDVFAGTGAFGLEALSRGARHAVFIEKDRDARASLQKNITALGETAHSAIVNGDATRPPRATGACSLVFLDPPYGEDLAAPALTALAQSGWLADNALAVVEIAAKEDLEVPENFEALDERRYGAAKFVFLRYAPSP
ncbi:MAG TPA: 16S rRNA (guanine(966)-N(2))-methyltransferase RsmD [Stellaceae bacterium]|nr:16S rRNA (guanine(966)-N(2))-methyltransferase RsmD [Stellaceae bacterium]